VHRGKVDIMAILITGGAGYIGSHTCVELLNSGFELVVIDNFSNSQQESLERVKEITGKDLTFYCVDILSKTDLRLIFQKHSIDGVIHFAGLKSVGESVSEPLRYYQNNVVGTLNLCEVMAENGVKNLVFSSSATVYGIPKHVPIPEDSSLMPVNPYGRTKWMIEEIVRDVALSDSAWSMALLRYFNPVGAHKSGKLGENPTGTPNNLMPYITQVAVGKLSELKVYGSDYPTIDGTGVRDYIHVVDLAKGHVKALEKVFSSQGVEAYNLGTGKGYSVLEIVKTFEQESGKVIPYQIVDRRPGDVATCYADVSKSKARLDWSATKGIAEMCRDSWYWQKNNPNGY
jgi:UDP-glucose 4-epimerase